MLRFAPRFGSRPLRAALLWQLAVTAGLTPIAGLTGGSPAAISTALGGGAVVLANFAYATVVGWHRPASALGTLRSLLRAEATKLLVLILELWLVFTVFPELRPVPFLVALIAAVLVAPVALLYRE